MIYSINYCDMAERINPLTFARYLRETGWFEIKRKNTSIQLFQLEKDNEFFQITLPMDRALSDYKIAMNYAVETLAVAEGKPMEKILLYLLNPCSDIIKIRFENKKIEQGNIVLDEAIRLFENAKKMVAATALDLINPNKCHWGRIDEKVTKFVSSCRFGQTEIGSYIVSIVCPFAEINESNQYQQLSLFSDEDSCANSFTRQVTTKFFENILIIKSKIDSGEYNDLCEKFDDYKISANFLEALNGISVDSENDFAEFSAEWSPIVKQRQKLCNRIMLTRDYCQPISTIVENLKAVPMTYKEIVGRVGTLNSIPAVEKRESGKITISYMAEDNKAHTVTTTLGKVDYDKAIEAHQKGKYVKAIGEVKLNGKSQYLECTSFEIID